MIVAGPPTGKPAGRCQCGPRRLGRSNYAAAKSRLAVYGARRCEHAWAAENLRRRLARRCPRPRVGVARITQDLKIKRKGVVTRNHISSSRQNTNVP